MCAHQWERTWRWYNDRQAIGVICKIQDMLLTVGIQSARELNLWLENVEAKEQAGAARATMLMVNGDTSDTATRVKSLTHRQRDRLRVVEAG
jgi:hypothetical protein